MRARARPVLACCKPIRQLPETLRLQAPEPGPKDEPHPTIKVPQIHHLDQHDEANRDRT